MDARAGNPGRRTGSLLFCDRPGRPGSSSMRLREEGETRRSHARGHPRCFRRSRSGFASSFLIWFFMCSRFRSILIFFVQSAPFYSSRSVWSLRLDVVGLCQLLARLYYSRFALNYFRFPGDGRDLGRCLRRGCFARAAGCDRMRVTRILFFCFCLDLSP
jgi:hypothetical protein